MIILTSQIIFYEDFSFKERFVINYPLPINFSPYIGGTGKVAYLQKGDLQIRWQNPQELH